MSPFIELTKEYLTPLLHEIIARSLSASPARCAWVVDEEVWIDALSLAAGLSLGVKRIPRQLRPNDLVDVLVKHNLIVRPQRYVLTYESGFGGLARWRPLVQLAKQDLPSETLQEAFTWFHHEVEDYPFMTLGIPGAMHAIRHPVNPWRISLLLPDPTTLVSHRRVFPILPTPHAVITTYHGDSSGGSAQGARSAGE